MTATSLINKHKIPDRSYTISEGDRLSPTDKAVYFDKALRKYIPTTLVKELELLGYTVFL